MTKYMQRRFQQTGAFILVTVVFLMVAGGAMLYAMTNLSVVSSATNSLAHNGNMALAAAQSGLKYCLAGLETGDCLASPLIGGITTPAPAPCNIVIVQGCSVASAPAICTITSTAICPNVTPCPNPAEPFCGIKTLSIQIQKTAGGYQMIPASRQVVP